MIMTGANKTAARRAAWMARTAIALTAAMALSSCAVLPPAPPADDTIGPRAAPTTAPSEVAAAPGAGPSGPPVATAPLSQPAAPATAPAPGPSGPLSLTVDQAILMALEHNQALRVQRLEPAIGRTFEQQERAEFDPILSAEASYARRRAPRDSDDDRVTTGEALLGAILSQHLPTGADVSAGLTNDLTTLDLRDDRYVTRLGLSVNQALLQGAGLSVNLATVRQARLDTLASEYELRGFAEALVAQTEQTYWDYAMALRTIEIVTNAMTLARQQIQETRERVNVGTLAETELAAAEAELARRRENLINARGALAIVRLRLLRLLNPQREDFWQAELALQSAPAAPEVQLDDVETYVQVALRMRPELNQARLGIQRGDLELVKTRNGLLPRLDLFVTLGKSGYAESFGRGYADLSEDGYDALVGLRLEYPPANRAAAARHQRAQYSREQALRALENLSQLAQVDVRSAYVEVGRALEQVAATAATRRLQEETLRVETEKFRVGKSTNFQVAQAQRDLLESRISEVRAGVAYLKALTDLHLQQGALLERRGIIAPGAGPVDMRWPSPVSPAPARR